VDDEPTILDFGYVALSAAGYRVATAANGESALRQASEREYDVIVTDLRMPRMGGLEFSRRLIDRQPRMAGRILFITGDIAAITRPGNGLPAGSRWLTKPFSHEQLLEAIAALLPAQGGRKALPGATQGL
jgi:two-component system OmpR family response regulator